MNRRNMQILFFGLLVLLAGYMINGCGGGSNNSSGNNNNSNPPPQTHNATVSVSNNAAAPMGFAFNSPVTVSSGTVVVWANQSSAPHSIVWDNFSPSSSPSSGSNIATFQAGANSSSWTAPTVITNTTYNYHCGIHGPTMAGMIIVTP